MNPAPPARWGTAAFLLLVFMAALGMRLAYIRTTVVDTPIRADAYQYATYGYNIAHYGVFSREAAAPPTPDSARSPGFPLLAALGFLVGGKSGFYPFVLHTQAVLGALLAVMAFFLARFTLPFGWSAAVAALVAFSPQLVSITGFFLTETLFSFCLLAAVLAYAWCERSGGWPGYALAGLLFGAAGLVNETAFPLPFLLAAMAAWKLRRKGASREETAVGARRLGILLGAVLLAWGAWTARNAISVPPGADRGSGRAIQALSHGSYPGFVFRTERWKFYSYKEDPEQPAYGESLSTFLRVFSARAMERPSRYASWYLLEKPFWLWGFRPTQEFSDVAIYPVLKSLYSASDAAELTRLAFRAIHPAVLLFALWGVILFAASPRLPRRLRRPEPAPTAIFAVFLYFTALFCVFAPFTRYGIPLRPYLYIAAVWALWTSVGALFPSGDKTRKGTP